MAKKSKSVSLLWGYTSKLKDVFRKSNSLAYSYPCKVPIRYIHSETCQYNPGIFAKTFNPSELLRNVIENHIIF